MTVSVIYHWMPETYSIWSLWTSSFP